MLLIDASKFISAIPGMLFIFDLWRT